MLVKCCSKRNWKRSKTIKNSLNVEIRQKTPKIFIHSNFSTSRHFFFNIINAMQLLFSEAVNNSSCYKSYRCYCKQKILILKREKKHICNVFHCICMRNVIIAVFLSITNAYAENEEISMYLSRHAPALQRL